MFLDKETVKQRRRAEKDARRAAKDDGHAVHEPPIEFHPVKCAYYLGHELAPGLIAGRGSSVAMVSSGPDDLVVWVDGGELHVPWGAVTSWAELPTADVPGYRERYAAAKVAGYATRRGDGADAERPAVAIVYRADGVEAAVYLTFFHRKEFRAMAHGLSERLGSAAAAVPTFHDPGSAAAA